jgi:hypothetical protein
MFNMERRRIGADDRLNRELGVLRGTLHAQPTMLGGDSQKSNVQEISAAEAEAFVGLLAFLVLTDNSIEQAAAFVTPARIESARRGLAENLPQISPNDQEALRIGPELWDLVRTEWSDLTSDERQAIKEAWPIRLASQIVITS